MESGSNNSIRVLCTRPIPGELVEEAAAKGIAVDVLSFIETEPIESVEVQQEIENALILSATVVFTSMNAVEAVAEFLFDEQPDWKIYCMGNTTRQLVKKYFGEQAIQSTAENATALAEKIVENEMPEEILFFCGDQRRDELPQLLKQQDVEVNEIVVYHTIAVPHKISRDYTAVLFFSPSAVESFFSANKAGDKMIFFAIGNTTALAIKKHTANRVLIGDAPGKEELVKDMISFFAVQN
jgi:uroporphyrinogen-III synthase